MIQTKQDKAYDLINWKEIYQPLGWSAEHKIILF